MVSNSPPPEGDTGPDIGEPIATTGTPLLSAALEYLTDFPTRTVDVRFNDTRDLAFRESAANLRTLVRAGKVAPVFSRRHGYLKYLILLVSVIEARRMVAAANRPPAPPRSITKATAKPLGWAVRCDMARSDLGCRGTLGAHQTLFVRGRG